MIRTLTGIPASSSDRRTTPSPGPMTRASTGSADPVASWRSPTRTTRSGLASRGTFKRFWEIGIRNSKKRAARRNSSTSTSRTGARSSLIDRRKASTPANSASATAEASSLRSSAANSRSAAQQSKERIRSIFQALPPSACRSFSARPIASSSTRASSRPSTMILAFNSVPE